jgi:hypothetical protein
MECYELAFNYCYFIAIIIKQIFHHFAVLQHNR